MEQTDRGPGGAGSSGGHGGAGSSGGHGGAGSSGGHGGTASETAAPAPTSVSSAGALLPPPKISLGQLRGIRSPPGLNTETVKKTVVTDWSNTATAGWLSIRQRPAGDTHNRLGLTNNGSSRRLDHTTAGAGGLEGASAGCGRRVGLPRVEARETEVGRGRRRETDSGELAFPADDQWHKSAAIRRA